MRLRQEHAFQREVAADATSLPHVRLADTDRLEAFSDGVFSITITLLVVEIVRPEHEPGHLLDKLLGQWPNYIAFLASFCYVGVIWLNHRAVFSRVRYCDRTLHITNLFVLLTSALIPFPTALLSFALQHGNLFDAKVAEAVYAVIGGLMCLAWLFQFHVLTIHPYLLEKGIDPAFFPRERVRAWVGIALYAVAALIGWFWSPLLALAIYLGLPVFYGITHAATKRTVVLPSGERVPALGLGTWHFGEDASLRAQQIATLRHAVGLGVTLIDTAEMYGEGLAEQLIGEALSDRRDEVFLVSKVYPHHASSRQLPVACANSLRRLRTDRIDLYLLHWRGSVPLHETVAAFQALQDAGKIRYWGVSNFDTDDMKELWKVAGGTAVATNQILYNLTRRGPEWDLLPWLRQHKIPVMAYSPIEQARLLKNGKLVEFAKRHGMTPANAALAWLLSKDDVIAIPKISSPKRIEENVSALDIKLTPEQLAELDQLFPPPDGPRPLEML